MSVCLNKVILIGYAGRDPVIATSVNGRRYAKFSVATDESFRDEYGNYLQAVQWHNIMIWGDGADLVARSVRKGTRVMVEGKLETSIFMDRKTGQQRSYTRVVAHEVVPLNEIMADTGTGNGYGFGPGDADLAYNGGYGYGTSVSSSDEIPAESEFDGISEGEDDYDYLSSGGDYENYGSKQDPAMKALSDIYFETGDGGLLTELERGCLM